MLCLLMMSVRGEVYMEYRMGPGEHHKGDSGLMSAQSRSSRTGSSRINKVVSNLRLSQLFRNDVLA